MHICVTQPQWVNLGAISQEMLNTSLTKICYNKANLRDLIAVTGLVILLKLDSNRQFFSREMPNLGQNGRFFEPCDLEIWRMTLRNNRAPLLCYFKLCAAFHSHWWIQTVVTVRKHLIWVKIDDFLSRVNLKFDRWPWKTIGHLFYATSSFVHLFLAIGVFKLEFQSGKTQSGSKSTIFFTCVTLKFDRWPSKTIGHLF